MAFPRVSCATHTGERLLVFTPELHFTINQLCEIWFGENPNPPTFKNEKGEVFSQKPHPRYHMVRRWFQNEPDVIDGRSRQKGDRPGKKKHKRWLIPESTAQRVYNERM